jgi:hypothetical protein
MAGDPSATMAYNVQLTEVRAPASICPMPGAVRALLFLSPRASARANKWSEAKCFARGQGPSTGGGWPAEERSAYVELCEVRAPSSKVRLDRKFIELVLKGRSVLKLCSLKINVAKGRGLKVAIEKFRCLQVDVTPNGG